MTVRFRWRLLLSLAACVASLSGCPYPSEPINAPYRLEILAGFGNEASPSYGGVPFRSYAYAIGPTGRVAGMAEDENPRESLRGAIWEADVTVPTAIAAGGVVLEIAFGINGAGEVVGYGRCGDMGTACLWDGIELRSPGWLDYDGFSRPLAINNRSEVVGWSDAAPAGFDHAVLWRDGVAYDLGTLGGVQSQALDIDDSSRVVGWARPEDGSSHAFLWRDGEMQDLGTFGEPGSVAHGINEGGKVVGWVGSVGVTARKAFVWLDGEMTLLPGSEPSQAFGLNNQGYIVGTYTPIGTTIRAALWVDGTRYDLNDLTGDDRVALEIATAINDAGQIVGVGRWKYRDQREFGYRLTPTQPFPPP